MDEQIERILEVVEAVARLNECCDRDKAILATRGSEGVLNFLMCRRLIGGLLERRILLETRTIDIPRIDIVAYGANGIPRIAIEAKSIPLKDLNAKSRISNQKLKQIKDDKENKLDQIPNDYRNTLTPFILIWFCNPYNYVPLDLFLHAKEGNSPVSLGARECDITDVNRDCLKIWNQEASNKILKHLDLEFFHYFDVYDISPVDHHLFPEGHRFLENKKNIGVHCACSVFPLIEVGCMDEFRAAWEKKTETYPILPLVQR